MRRQDSGRGMRWDDRGVSGVEYAVIIAGIAAIITMSVPIFSAGANETFCEAGSALSESGECQPESTAAPGPGGSTNPGGGGGSTGGGQPTEPADPPGQPSAEPSDPPGGPQTTPNPEPSAAPNSPGWQQFNLTAIDQDQELHRLSVRTNISWFPTDWNSPVYPDKTTIDIKWSPALEYDRAILGHDGTWTAELVGTGHIRMVRTGVFDTSGFQPEPELLLIKPDTQQTVTATWTVQTGNTPPITAQSSTVSVPYNR